MRKVLAGILLVSACSVVPDHGTLPGAPRIDRTQVVALEGGLEAYDDSLELAVDFWNDAIDRTVLAVGPYDSADIVIRIGAPRGSWLGHTQPGSGLISYTAPGDTYQAYLVFAHELGHAAFWLADDPDHGYSVMAGVGGASNEADGILWPNMRHVAVTANDIARIKERL
jgi:hypothetical protein